MLEDERQMTINHESIGLGTLLGNINIHHIEDSNKLFKNYEYFEARELMVQSPQKETRLVPPTGMMIEEINVVAIKEVRYVNPKQWERMMKRRVKREMEKFRKTVEEAQQQPSQDQLQLTDKKQKYKYESRHLHAKKRQRNLKGRFVRSRISFNAAKPMPEEGSSIIKKKRGRKSKKELEEIRLRDAPKPNPSQFKQNDTQYSNKYPIQSTCDSVQRQFASERC